MSEKWTDDYQRGYDAGHHAGSRSQRRVQHPAPDAVVANVVLRKRWPDAVIGEVRTFGGRAHPFRWTGRSWQRLTGAK